MKIWSAGPVIARLKGPTCNAIYTPMVTPPPISWLNVSQNQKTPNKRDFQEVLDEKTECIMNQFIMLFKRFQMFCL